MRKTQIILLIFLAVTLLSGCNKKDAQSFNIMPENTYSIDPRNPGKYATSLNSVTKNKKPLKCKNGLYSWEAKITNVYDGADYGLMLFVNGVQTRFSTSFDKTECEMHFVSLRESDSIKFNVNVRESEIPADDEIYASLVTILNPNHTLKTTQYINYFPHHSLASFTFYTLEKTEKSDLANKEYPVAETSERLSAELDNEYMTEITEYDGSTRRINALDSLNDFLLTQNDEFSKTVPLYTVVRGNALKLKLGCLGKSERFRISVYINNKIVPAFDGEYYCDVKTQRTLILTEYITLSEQFLSQFDEINHIYLIAVPIKPSFNEEQYDRPIKTATKMLYISDEESIKKLTDSLYIEETENRNYSTESTAIKETTIYATEDMYNGTDALSKECDISTVHTSEEPEKASVSSENFSIGIPVWDLWVLDEKSVLVKSTEDGNLYLFDIEKERFTKCVQGGEKVQKLDNGFAVLTLHNSGYTVYDNNLNEIESGFLPYSGENDELTYAVSQDGKKVAYCINENGRGKLYIDSVYQNGRKLIASFAEKPKAGDILWVNEIAAFDDRGILFEGSYIEHFAPGKNAVCQTCYGCITDSGSILTQPSDGYNRLCYKGSNMVIADNSPLSADKTDGTVEFWNIDKRKKESFRFMNGNESRYAVISESGKYIASEEIHLDCSGITIRIYDVISKDVIYKETYSYSSLEAYPIDFCENEGFAFIASENVLKKIILT